LKAWDRHVDATFFWTAHNEIEAKWDYVKAWDLGWIDKPLTPKKEIETIKSELRKIKRELKKEIKK